MIVTALVNTTYKRKPFKAGESFDMDAETAKIMLKEKLVRKGGAPKPESLEETDDQGGDK